MRKVRKYKRVSSYARLRGFVFKAIALFFIMLSFLLIYPNFSDIRDSVLEALELDEHFALKNINLYNNDKVTSEDVNLKLAPYLDTNLLFVDLFEINEKVKEIPYVKSAIVERVLPDTLNLHIDEEFPEAVFLQNGEDYLLSRTGKMLDKANESEKMSYLRVEGANANLYFLPVVNILNKFPQLNNNVQQLTYIKERRWNIKLKNDLVILLPADKEKFALEIFLDKMPSLLEKQSPYIVDLRLIPDKIFIRAQ